MSRHAPRFTLLLALVLPAGFASAQSDSLPTNEVEVIRVDSGQFGKYGYFCVVRRGLLYREVLEEAKRLFPEGLRVDRSEFPPCIRECRHLVATDPDYQQNDLTEYCLFSGSNGIIGQMVVLLVDADDRVARVEVKGWGR